MKSLATVQACLTEFMAMQTAFDQVNYKAITNLQLSADEKDNNMATIPEKSTSETKQPPDDQEKPKEAKKQPKDSDVIMYRDISFNTQDLLDIRYVIQHKVEQVFSQSELW